VGSEMCISDRLYLQGGNCGS